MGKESTSSTTFSLVIISNVTILYGKKEDLDEYYLYYTRPGPTPEVSFCSKGLYIINYLPAHIISNLSISLALGKGIKSQR